MKIFKVIAFTFIVLSVLVVGVFFVWPKQDSLQEQDDSQNLPVDAPPSPFSVIQTDSFELPTDEPADTQGQTTHLFQPTVDFQNKVTKKPFAIYVSPDSSPVSPERFTGYHTGADAEYGETSGEITVHAISDGTVRSSRRANGYGGIVVIEHTINDESFLVIYGHLDPDSLISESVSVTAGQQIGVLGKGGTDETDRERKHLHLGILTSTKLDIRGYVQSASELSNWLDPLTFFKLD